MLSFRLTISTFSPCIQQLHHSTSLKYSSVPFTEKKVDVLNVGINIIENINSKHVPPIIFLPGTFGSIEMDFKPIMPQLNREKYKWVAWDPPGYGKSRPPQRYFGECGFSHIKDVEYLKELLTILGHEKYILLAWSGAGFTAMKFAAEQPEKISGLITWGAFGYVTQKSVAGMKAMRQLGLAAIPDARKIPLVAMYGEDRLLDMWVAWCDEGIKMADSETFKLGGNFENIMQRVQCPSLILHGSKDALISLEQMDHMNKNLRNSRVQLVQNGTHNLHLRQTELFIKSVEQFVDEIHTK